MDVRPGGVRQHIMHDLDGVDYSHSSVFKEVAKPEYIVFSCGGDKTRATIHIVCSNAADRGRLVTEYGAIEDGKQSLERLAACLASIEGETADARLRKL